MILYSCTKILKKSRHALCSHKSLQEEADRVGWERHCQNQEWLGSRAQGALGRGVDDPRASAAAGEPVDDLVREADKADLSPLATLLREWQATQRVRYMDARAKICLVCESPGGMLSLVLPDESAAIELIPTVKTDPRVRRLSLHLPSLTECGAFPLAELLKFDGRHLRCVTLRHCKIDESSVVLLAEALCLNKNLFALDLSSNSVGEKGALAFAKMLTINRTLSSLFLGSCCITPTGIVAISRSLRVNRTLAKLGMAGQKYSLQANSVEFDEEEWDAAWIDCVKRMQ
jgi:hypothetical protein